MKSIKFKIIYSLFVLAAILLLANVLLKQSKNSQPVQIGSANQLPNMSFDNRFVKVLSDWGIKDEWIKKLKVKNTKAVSGYIYQIELPYDITPDFILVDLRKTFDRKGEYLTAEDLLKRRKTLVKLFSNDKLMVEAFFRRNHKIKREKKDVTFCVDERDFDSEKLKKDIEIVIPLTFLFRPEKSMLNLKGEIRKHKHSFAIILDDQLADGDFNLFSSDDKFVLKMAVRKLVSAFGEKTIYLYDNKSNFFKSVTFNFIRDKFKDLYGIDLLSMSRIKDLTTKSPEDISSIVKIYITGSGPNIFLVKDEQLENLKPLFSSLWKKGIRFVTLNNAL